GPNPTSHGFRELGQVQSVHVVEHDHEPVFGPELVDGTQHEPSELRLLGDVGRRALVVLERHVGSLVEGREDHALARAPVVRKIDRDPIQPRPERIVGLEPGESAMRAGERVDDDLFRGRGVLGDREAEAEDPVPVPVEERVEGDGVAVPGRVHELVVGAAIPGPGVAAGCGRYVRMTLSLRSGPSRLCSTTPPFIGAWTNSVALVASATWVTESAPKNMRSPARASSTFRPSMAC